MLPRLALAALCLFSVVARAQEEDGEEEAKSVVLLYKKMDPMEDFAVNEPINVTLTVFNKGLGNAYSLDGGGRQLEVGQVSHRFRRQQLLPRLPQRRRPVHASVHGRAIKKTWHRVRAAKMAYIDGVEGENTILHQSNTLPDIRVAESKTSDLVQMLLVVGRVVTLNQVRTEEGWQKALKLLGGLLVLQVVFIGKGPLSKRRHLRALDEVKKM